MRWRQDPINNHIDLHFQQPVNQQRNFIRPFNNTAWHNSLPVDQRIFMAARITKGRSVRLGEEDNSKISIKNYRKVRYAQPTLAKNMVGFVGQQGPHGVDDPLAGGWGLWRGSDYEHQGHPG
jgi:hypothetical protein